MKLYRIDRLLALLLSLWAVSGLAAEASRALIVGVATYQDPQVPALKGVVHDMESARKIAAAMGISDTNIQYLKDAQATKENILGALKKLGERLLMGRAYLCIFPGMVLDIAFLPKKLH